MLLPADSHRRLNHPLLLIAPFFLWGTAMVAMKGMMAATNPYFVAGVRLVPAGLLVLAVAAWQRKPQPQGWRAWVWVGLFALVDGLMFQGFLAQGLTRTGAGLGSVMIDSQPLAVALFARWFYGERIGGWGWLGLAVGLLGIALIGLPDAWVEHLLRGEIFIASQSSLTELATRLFNSGEFFMLLAALSMAVGTIMIPRVSKHTDPVVATGWHMVLGGLPLLAASLLGAHLPWEQLTLGAWFNLGYATVFGSALAYGLFFYFAAAGNLTSLSALTFLTPVFALVFGQLVLGEFLTPIQLSGVLLTLVSIYLVNQRQQIQIWLLQLRFRNRPIPDSKVPAAELARLEASNKH